MAQLIVVRDGDGNQRIQLSDTSVTLGRARDNSLALPDRAVSRHHAEILLISGVWTIRDLDSRNGVLVNGEPITERPLLDGDVITIGETTLRFRGEETAAPPAAMPAEAESPAPSSPPAPEPPPPAAEQPSPETPPAETVAPEPAPAPKPAPRTGPGPVDFDWLPLSALMMCWPPGEGPSLVDEPLTRETLIHRPVKAHPLLPEHVLLMSLARPFLVRHAELLQEIDAALLGGRSPDGVFAPILDTVMRMVGEPWAAALYPAEGDKPLQLVTVGKPSASSRIPLLLVEAAARSQHAVIWCASLGAPETLLPAFFVVPWQANPKTGGLLFGPAPRQTPADLAPTLDLLAGIGNHVGRWWPSVSARWRAEPPVSPNERTWPPLMPPPL